MYQDRPGVSPPQASIATKNLSGALPGTLPKGGSFTGGHLHHPGALHDEEGVVHPQGWGYVPVAMCLISLSLSRVLSHVPSMARPWCIPSFAIVVGSYDVSPLYSLVMNWVSPLKLSYQIESLRIWEHLMYVLRGIPMVTMGYSIDSLDVCFGDQLAGSTHEPMHRGWHTFLTLR